MGNAHVSARCLAARSSGQITDKNASALRCQLVAEGANGPTTLEANRILEDRGILVVPDILTNSGGVIASYFEWAQDLKNPFLSSEDVSVRITTILERGFRPCWRPRPNTVSISAPPHSSPASDGSPMPSGAAACSPSTAVLSELPRRGCEGSQNHVSSVPPLLNVSRAAPATSTLILGAT